MTAKEKAEELVRKYSSSELVSIVHGLQHDDAIECAKIAVDEIIIQLAEINNKESFNVSSYANYCQEVKKELEKM